MSMHILTFVESKRIMLQWFYKILQKIFDNSEPFFAHAYSIVITTKMSSVRQQSSAAYPPVVVVSNGARVQASVLSTTVSFL